MRKKHMCVAQRFKNARLEMGFSQKKLGDLVGITQQGVHDIESGKVKMPINIEKFSVALKKEKEWLLFGTNILKNENEHNIKIPVHSLLNTIARDTICSLSNQSTEEKIVINAKKYGENCFAVKIGDNAMVNEGEKSFNINDTVIVSPDLSPEDGKYVVAIEDSSSYIVLRKYVVNVMKKYLIPLNLDFPAIEVNDHTKILGVAVAHIDENL